MQIYDDLGIVLRSMPYNERDKIVTLLTEHHGKVTGIVKGGHGSKRFGGALDLLCCSKFHIVEKPNHEMVRVDEALIHHEFKSLRLDYDKLLVASFAAELCLKLIETSYKQRELFIVLSNFLFYLDSGLSHDVSLYAFLLKFFKQLGYVPMINICVRCEKELQLLLSEGVADFFWISEAGGLVCKNCSGGNSTNSPGKKLRLGPEEIQAFYFLLHQPFKSLQETDFKLSPTSTLGSLIMDFLHHQIPGVPAGGFKTWPLIRI